MFKCSSCGHRMDSWKNGSRCTDCAGKPDSAFVKAGAGATDSAAAVKAPAAGSAAKKPAGNVQDEFPKCPSCGTPTKDGTKCDDCRMSTDREHETGELTVAQMRAQARAAEADAEEEDDRRKIRHRARSVMARYLGLDKDVEKAAALAVVAGNPPTVLKSNAAKRYSFAPMYMPGRVDAHGEFVKSADDLQLATWDYVEKTAGSREVFLQHMDQPAGKWVEVVAWPYAVEAAMTMPGTGAVRKAKLPAGTVYLGVKWEPWAWELVQKGKLLGFSMGGWAKRVEAELADPDVTKSAGSFGPSGEPRAKFDEAEARRILGLD